MLWCCLLLLYAGLAPSNQVDAVAAGRRAAVIDWVHWSDVLLRTFDGATTAAAVASSLGIQVASCRTLAGLSMACHVALYVASLQACCLTDQGHRASMNNNMHQQGL